MHAALITRRHTIEMVEFPEPVPHDRGVVVDISFCGICGTDVHAYQSGRDYNPAICGHEWAGTVTATGRHVTRLREGDRVVVAVPPPCGECGACRAGKAERCEPLFLTTHGREPGAPVHGGFAPRIAVNASRVVKADDRLSDEQLALVEPSAVAFHAVRRSGIRLGDLAVVQGAGPIGLCTLQLVKAAGALEVIVVEPNERRAALALDLGASFAVAPGEARALIDDHSAGMGADIVYECAGTPRTVQAGVDLARRGGSLCLIGLADGDVAISPGQWLSKEISVTSALAYQHEEFAMVMSMIADGRLDVTHQHTSTTSLAGLEAALADLGSGVSEQSKVLVNPRW